MYGISANNAHRALDDVLVLWKVFKEMSDDLSISQAYELMQQKHALTRMPFGKHRGLPLEQVPGSYYRWLANSGALDKPDNEELKTRLEELQLLP
jgi:DNA polymerase-3 subunit epsilon